MGDVRRLSGPELDESSVEPSRLDRLTTALERLHNKLDRLAQVIENDREKKRGKPPVRTRRQAKEPDKLSEKANRNVSALLDRLGVRE